MHISMSILLLFCLSFTTLINRTVGVCCQDDASIGMLFLGQAGTCADGTIPGVTKTEDGSLCCGVGSCNIFCCACEGGCKVMQRPVGTPVVTGRRRRATFPGRRELPPSYFLDGYDLIDTDGNGLVSFDEATQHAKSGASGSSASKGDLVKEEFDKLDLNRDGYLNRTEIGGDTN